MQTSAPHRWQLVREPRFVVLMVDRLPQRSLVSKFMSSIKCFDLSPQVHTVQALSGSNFFRLTEKASYSTVHSLACFSMKTTS